MNRSFRGALTAVVLLGGFCLPRPRLAAQSDDASSRSRATVSISPVDASRNVVGHWTSIAVTGSNPTTEDAVETGVVSVGDSDSLQYARELWIPAGATRMSWLPLKIPAGLSRTENRIMMSSMHLKTSEEGESFQANQVGMPSSERSLLLSREAFRTAVYWRQLDSRPGFQPQHYSLIDTIYAGRDLEAADDQDLGLVILKERLLPPHAKAFDSLDQLVIAGDGLLSDTDGIVRLRTWVQGGGRLWIMVDQVSEDAVTRLLGDAACYSVVDRTELNDFQIEQTDPISIADGLTPQFWQSETPVELVRVIVDTEDVTCRVNGWPAAFWKQAGEGEILFTTLAGDGWLQDKKPTRAYASLARRFFAVRPPIADHGDELAKLMDQEIGYRIPRRGTIATVLALHLLILVVSGVVLSLRYSLQHLAWLVPVIALGASGTLLAIGKQRTSTVPPTIATGQIARVIPQTHLVHVNSVASVYSDQSRALPIVSSPQSTTDVLQAGSETSVKRIVWDDTGQSRWHFVEQPLGVVRHVESESVIRTDSVWALEGGFDKNGFRGQLMGLDPQQVQSGVIISQTAPSLTIDLNRQAGGSSSGIAEVLAPGQYFGGALVSQQQQIRQSLFRDLMSGPIPLVRREPQLAVWTDSLDSGVTFDDGFQKRGSALVLIPIQWQNLAPQQEFLVPATFVRLESFAGKLGISPLFNAETGRWLDQMNRPGQAALRCLPPKAVLPCKLGRATVQVKIKAPARTFQVKAFQDDEFVTVFEVDNPTGLVEFDITDPRALALDEQGSLRLMLAVTATEQDRQAQQSAEIPSSESIAPNFQRRDLEQTSRDYWQIDYVRVHLAGTRTSSTPEQSP